MLDRTSGGDFVIPVSPSAVRVIGNPVRPEVYVNDAAGGLALAASGARRMNTPSCGSSVEARSVSADGRPNTPNVYVMSGYTVEPGTPFNQIVVFGADTFSAVVSLDQLSRSFENPGVFAPAPRPAAPATLAAGCQQLERAAVVERRQSDGGHHALRARSWLRAKAGGYLHWTRRGSADVVLGEWCAARTLYVRVRAGNYTGLGAPSNEVLVQVP